MMFFSAKGTSLFMKRNHFVLTYTHFQKLSFLRKYLYYLWEQNIWKVDTNMQVFATEPPERCENGLHSDLQNVSYWLCAWEY